MKQKYLHVFQGQVLNKKVPKSHLFIYFFLSHNYFLVEIYKVRYLI